LSLLKSSQELLFGSQEVFFGKYGAGAKQGAMGPVHRAGWVWDAASGAPAAKKLRAPVVRAQARRIKAPTSFSVA